MNVWDYPQDALEVCVSDLIIATADYSDQLIDENVRYVLQDLRKHLNMDVIFFSEIRDGKRMFKHVDNKPGCELISTGGGSRLEESFCQCVLEGRLPRLVQDAAQFKKSAALPDTPFPVGAHLSAPIVLADGIVYGTLCCFSLAADPTLTEKDLRKLECVARVAAKRIDIRLAAEREQETSNESLEPMAQDKQAEWSSKLAKN